MCKQQCYADNKLELANNTYSTPIKSNIVDIKRLLEPIGAMKKHFRCWKLIQMYRCAVVQHK